MSTKRFFGLVKPRISMDSPTGTPRAIAPPKNIRLPLAGEGADSQAAVAVRAGQTVQGGQLLANPAGRDPVHAPLAGEVGAVGETVGAGGAKVAMLELAVSGQNAWVKAQPVEDIAAADSDALHQALAAVGIRLPWQAAGAELRSILVMAIDREPGLGVQNYFLTGGLDEFKGALGLLRRLTGSVPIKLAVPAALQGQWSGLADIEILPVAPRYPDCHWRLVLARACGVRNVTVEGARAAGHHFLTAEHLTLAFRALKSGLPRTTKLLTASGKGLAQPLLVEAPIGTPVGHLLRELDIELEDGDRVLFGGRWLGQAQYDLDAPIHLGTDGLTVVAAAEAVPLTDNPCIHCGRCVAVCPVKIQVGVVARYAEFALVAEAYGLGASACIECGCCAYVCPAQRPLVQYMRYAIEQFEKAQAAALAEAAAGTEAAAATIATTV